MTFSNFARSAVCLLLIVLVAACATNRPAPVEERARSGTPPRVATPSPQGAGATATPQGDVPTYTVRRGDTLYQIALDNGLDYRELAAWNMIENVNVIRVGQVLRLLPPGETLASASPSSSAAATPPSNADGVVTVPLRTTPPISESRPGVPPAPGGSASGVPHAATSQTAIASGNLKTAPKAIKEPYSERAVHELQVAATSPPPEVVASAAPTLRPEAKPDAPHAAAPENGDDDHIEWVWPARGKVISGFSDTANLKGIDIAGKDGDPVVASAAGKVVYAGSGLRGYGKLVIIKHNKTYLSAYAHNREILVKEGQQVAKGQKIAEMGSSDAEQVMLHFEIRRLGKPMDPARFLPAG